ARRDRRLDELRAETADESRVVQHRVPRDLDEATLLRILEHLLGRTEELRELEGSFLRFRQRRDRVRRTVEPGVAGAERPGRDERSLRPVGDRAALVVEDRSLVRRLD